MEVPINSVIVGLRGRGFYSHVEGCLMAQLLLEVSVVCALQLTERHSSAVVKSAGLGGGPVGSRSGLSRLLPVLTCASYLTSLWFTFFICKRGMIIVPTS